MSLINCPECGKEISDKSEKCIHCGYPLINTKCNINGTVYDFSEELKIALLDSVDESMPAIGSIRRKTLLHLSDAYDLVQIIKENKSIPSIFVPKRSLDKPENIFSNYNKNVIECPYCHSTNTKKISSLSKAGSVALFGIFGLGKTTKEWHCNNCNSDF